MAGKSVYSSEEDRIILDTAGQPVHYTVQVLRDGGFPARSESSVRQRRYYLRQRGEVSSLDLVHLDGANAELHQELTRLLAERARISSQMETLAKRGREVTLRLHELVAQLDRELSGDYMEQLPPGS